MTQRRIYQDEYPYSVTIRTSKDNYLFDDMQYTLVLSQVIFGAAEHKGMDVLAYQIMPDHIHIMVAKQYRAQATVPARGGNQTSAPTEGCAGNANISQYMHSLKSYFVYRLRTELGFHEPIWQKRFYTRIINTREYLETSVEYFKQNPVKESLSKQFHQMPYQYFNWPLINTLL